MRVRFIGSKKEMQTVREYIRDRPADDSMTVSKMHPNRNDPSEYRMYVQTDQISDLFGKTAK